MPQVISPKKTVEYLRSQDPYDTSYLTDREVYEHAQQRYPNHDYPIWGEDVKLPPPEEKVKLEEPDPRVIEQLFTSGISDLFADDSKFFADTMN